jgi:xylulokinase
MARAVLESTALAIRDVIGVMEEAGAVVSELRVTGKPGSSPFWNQLKADVSGKPLVVPRFGESELLGGVCMALTALGRYADLAEAAEDLVGLGRRHEPNPAQKGLYDELFGLYREGYAALKPLFPRLGELCSETSSKAVGGGEQ